MKMLPLAAIRFSIFLVVAALVVASLGAVWSRNEARDAREALERAHGELAEARRVLERSHQQKQLVVGYRDAYETLRARGFVGNENRLAWIEAAQQANRDAGLYGLDYRLTPRTAAAPELAQDLPLGQTRMTLNFPVLVETDVPRFLAALRQRAPGIFTVQSCRLTMPSRTEFRAVDQPRMQAECALLWFTIAQSNGGQP